MDIPTQNTPDTEQGNAEQVRKIDNVERSGEVASTVFSKYKKSDGKMRVLMIYLLLNDCDLAKVEKVVEIHQSEEFGRKFSKIYGETTEYIDIRRIEQELASIQTPVICSLQSYEIYSSSEMIYTYTPEFKDKPLYINDMGIISQLMVIDADYIVSSNMAAPLEDSEHQGFMFFVDYVRNGKCEVGDWTITYNSDREYSVYYNSHDENGQAHQELLYHAVEIDLSSTFKLTLYIISKVMAKMDNFISDNFKVDTWLLQKGGN